MKTIVIITCILVNSYISYGQKVIAAEGTGTGVKSDNQTIIDDTDLKLAEKNWEEGIEFIKAGHELKQKAYELKDPNLIKEATKKYVDANYSFHQALLAIRRFNARYPSKFPELTKMNEKPYQEKIDRAKELIAKESEEYNFVAGLKKGETVYHLTPGKTPLKSVAQDWNILYQEQKNKPAQISKTTVSDSNNLTVKIGNQIWMAKNLDVEKFRNGDPIPQAKSPEEWKKASDNKQPAWCYPEYKAENGINYGKLYNWFAVTDARGLAPSGYHIPNKQEWEQIKDFLGSDAGHQMKSRFFDWDGYTAFKETNDSRFNAIPAGYISTSYGRFERKNYDCYFWSKTSFIGGRGYEVAWFARVMYIEARLYIETYPTESHGLSVRCLKD